MNNSIVQVYHNLRANTVRTALTMVGLLVSAMMIVLIVTLGANVERYVMAEVESFGTDYVQIETKVPQAETFSRDNVGGRVGTKITTLTLEDMEALRALPHVRAASPGIIAQARVRSQYDTSTVLFIGANEEVHETDQQLELVDGRFFTARDVLGARRVLLLGSEVKTDLFGARRAVGERVKVNGQTYQVVGELKERGSAGFLSFDAFGYVPITVAQKQLLGVDYIDYITLAATNPDHLAQLARSATDVLRVRHNTRTVFEDDFSVSTPEEIGAQVDTIFRAINALLLFLALISLAVGGVGVMNVMLAAVEERVAEIGLRKALGARARDITRLFVWESLLVSCIGTIIGIVVAYALIFGIFAVVEARGLQLPQVVPWHAALLALIFGVVAGLIFGLYPARKAGRISPIAAMRR